MIDEKKLIEYIRENGIPGSYHSDTEREDYVIDMIESQPKVDEWIPCEKLLPEERKSIFARFKGTDKWRSAMFEKMSDNVNVTVEFEDGTRMSMKGYTVDGEWKPDTAVKCKVIAWQPLPEPYNPE